MTLKIVALGATLIVAAACDKAPETSPDTTVASERMDDDTDAVALAEQTIDNAMDAAQEAPPAPMTDAAE